MATNFDSQRLSRISVLLSDVDDTLTSSGRLLPDTLAMIYRLEEAGIKVIPITGACAGWCDHMARAWPVSAVIGENGAFYMRRTDNGFERSDWTPQAQMRADQAEVKTVVESLILPEFPGLALAADQPYRLADVAIDIGQDGRLDQQQVADIIERLHRRGINARASSIHINAWRGSFSKYAMAVRLLEDLYGLSGTPLQEQVAFVGDSANDETLFEGLSCTFGVANIARALAYMQHRPLEVLSRPMGAGFVELGERLLAARAH
ncbi:HAD-IIB family hydrolase [Marinobacterium sp. YM272]|uniref:HAD-IIB family hydrolase n=1 Tax=Marinobacterium sp. YM272 TaxID=3421654 RepID=UPI003D7F1A87